MCDALLTRFFLACFRPAPFRAREACSRTPAVKKFRTGRAGGTRTAQAASVTGPFCLIPFFAGEKCISLKSRVVDSDAASQPLPLPRAVYRPSRGEIFVSLIFFILCFFPALRLTFMWAVAERAGRQANQAGSALLAPKNR